MPPPIMNDPAGLSHLYLDGLSSLLDFFFNLRQLSFDLHDGIILGHGFYQKINIFWNLVKELIKLNQSIKILLRLFVGNYKIRL
jgi:hypothetical protein